MKRNRL